MDVSEAEVSRAQSDTGGGISCPLWLICKDQKAVDFTAYVLPPIGQRRY
jgi:hypothetical protein